MLGLGKDKDKKIDLKEEAKKEGDKQKNINLPQFRIVVYKPLGRDVPQEINSFYAKQVKDSSGSMYLVNEDNNFKESLAITKHPDIERLQDKLDIKKLKLAEQKALVREKIIEQEDKIRNIKDGVHIDDEGKKEKVNVIGEQKYLTHLKVLLYSIGKGDEGSFDAIDGEGFRQRFYLYDEGVLVPYFWDRKGVSLYPSNDTAIKHYRADQDLIDADFIDENKDKWANIGKGLMLVLFVILFIGNGFMLYKNIDRAGELDSRSTAMALAIEDSNFGQCIGQISTTNNALLEIINEYRSDLNDTGTNNLNTVNTDLT